MKKFIIILILLSCPVLGYTEVEYSKDNSTWQKYGETNENYIILEKLEDGINENDLYYFRVRHVYDQANSSWVYSSSRSDLSGEVSMASLAIIGFLSTVTFILIFLPMILKRFSNNEFLDYVSKRMCIIVGFLFLTLTITAVATVSETFGIGLTSMMFTILFLFNKVIYVSLVFTILLTGKKGLELWKGQKQSERFEDVDTY